MSLAKRSIRNIASHAASLAVSFADRLVLVGVLIRVWGTDLYADWVTLLAVTSLLTFFEFGFQVHLGNSLNQAAAKNDKPGFQRLVGLGFTFYSVLAIAVLTLSTIVVFVLGVDGLLTLDSNVSANYGTVYLILTTILALRMGRNALTQIFRGYGEYHRIIWTDVRVVAAAIAGSVGLALSGSSPLGVAAAYLAAELFLGWGLTTWTLRRRFPHLRMVPRIVRWTELWTVLSNLKWYALLQGLPGILLYLPILIIGWLGLGGAALVGFVVQRTLVNFVRTLSATVSQAVGVELAHLVSSDRLSEVIHGITVLARFNAALAGAMFAGFLVFGEAVIELWTGEPNLGSVPILLLLLLPVIVTAPSIPLAMLNMFASQPRNSGIAYLAQAVIGIPAAYYLGVEFGVIGVVLGITAAEVVSIGLFLPLLSARRFGVRYLPLAALCYLISGLSAAWCLSIGMLVDYAIPHSSLPSLILVMGLWSVMAVAPVIVIGLPKSSRRALVRHTQRLFQRCVSTNRHMVGR